MGMEIRQYGHLGHHWHSGRVVCLQLEGWQWGHIALTVGQWCVRWWARVRRHNMAAMVSHSTPGQRVKILSPPVCDCVLNE